MLTGTPLLHLYERCCCCVAQEVMDEVWHFIDAGAALPSARSAAAAPATEDEMRRLFRDVS